MHTNTFWRGVILVAGLIAASLLGGCGDDDDEPEEDEAELDLIALVVAALEEEPKRLPDGLTMDDSYFDFHFDSDDLATVSMEFSSPSGLEGFVAAVIYRTEARAREVLKEEAEFWEAVESKSARGHYCLWEDFPIYVNPDLEGVSDCFGRAGNVYFEVEIGEVPSSEPEAALEFLKAIERHFDGLASDATKRVRTVPPEPLGSLLSAVPPPGPGELEFAGERDYEFTDPNDVPGFVVKGIWWGDRAAGETAFFLVYDSPASADEYREGFASVAKKRGETGCTTPTDPKLRLCAHQVEEVVVIAQRLAPSASAPAVDTYLQDWTNALAEHVTGLRGGKLPRAPKATPTPAGTRTSSPTPGTRTVTPPPGTATLPPSNLTRVSAGTWTFTLTVSSNNCPGGLLPPGSTITRVYEFVDSDGDGFISRGESFSARMTTPVVLELGKLTFAIPNGSFVHPSTLGLLSGLATVQLTFTAENRVDVSYVEDYKTCKVSN